MVPFRSVAVTALLACAGFPAASQAQLNVLCSVPVEWCNQAATEFEKDTGVKVAMTPKLPRHALALLGEQSPNPRTDVWFGGTADTHLHAAKLDFLAEYKSPTLPQLQPWAQKLAEQSKFKSVGVYLRVLGIGYNTELVTRKKVAAPACWKDLIKPEFAGEVQIEDPRTSNSAYLTIVALTQIFGEDQAFKYLKSMRKVAPQKKSSGAEALKSVTKARPAAVPGAGVAPVVFSGSIASVAFVNDVAAGAEGGAPLKVAAPCEGTASDVGALSIVKGAKNLDNAKKFAEWALGPKGQAVGAKAKQLQYPANTSVPASPLVPKFADIKFIDYDSAKYDKSAERKRLIDRWEGVFGPPSR
ncbi:MAG: extracellular solute-binding protein [Betaproteobacteria bacterium]